jgi:acid phosphatase class B
MSAAAFINFYEKNLRPCEKSYAPLDVARALIEAGQNRGQAQVFVARRKRTSENDANSS